MSVEANINQYRRRFLGQAGVATAAVATVPLTSLLVSGSAQAKALDEPASSDNRWGMLVDASKCADGCKACVDACNDEHGLEDLGRPETDAQWIRKVTIKDKATGHIDTLPLMCQHCETAPCVDVCPTGASMRRADGIVLVDRHTCIGCRYCMMACPYKARSFVHEVLENQVTHQPRGKGCVESCTLCVHKLDAGDGSTACSEACAAEGHHAIIIGDLKDPNSDISRQLRASPTRQLRADLGLNTGVRYKGL
jgi:molybdopterin-containing oxidoreductase family iron-sulfur binding subunit